MFFWLDYLIFTAFIGACFFIGFFDRTEQDSEDYYLAGRSIPWWAIAGSLFGTNISASHLVGMLGIGFSVGFAQTHYELGAIPALLILGYVLLPVFMRLKIYTLSQYLEGRFGSAVGMSYSFLMILIIVVQLTAAFYIGSRSMNFLLGQTPLAVGYAGGVWALLIITGLYTAYGGSKAVIWTDVLQSSALIIAAVIVAWFTFAQPEVGGWSGMMANDARLADPKMILYLPSNHPDLPWTGVFTGLMFLHIFYWNTNQYLVQRALAARSLKDARAGIVAGGFLKLLVPFLCIAAGVAAAQLFAVRFAGQPAVAPDDAFPKLVETVVPMGYGLRGLIAAGLLGAITSTLSSMMNSSGTLVALDIYKRRINAAATEKQMVWVGRVAVVLVMVTSALMAIWAYDPLSQDNFFLKVSSQVSYFTPGIAVAFFAGIFFRKVSHRAVLIAIVLTPVFSYGLDSLYRELPEGSSIHLMFGVKLNFLHRTFLTAVLDVLTIMIGSRIWGDHAHAAGFTWHGEGKDWARLKRVLVLAVSVVTFLVALGVGVYFDLVGRSAAAVIAALSVFGAYYYQLKLVDRARHADMFFDDRFWAGIVAALTASILFVF